MAKYSRLNRLGCAFEAEVTIVQLRFSPNQHVDHLSAKNWHCLSRLKLTVHHDRLSMRSADASRGTAGKGIQ